MRRDACGVHAWPLGCPSYWLPLRFFTPEHILGMIPPSRCEVLALIYVDLLYAWRGTER